MSQRVAPQPMQADFESRASGIAMLLLRVTLLGTLAAFVGVLGLSTWRIITG